MSEATIELHTICRQCGRDLCARYNIHLRHTQFYCDYCILDQQVINDRDRVQFSRAIERMIQRMAAQGGIS